MKESFMASPTASVSRSISCSSFSSDENPSQQISPPRITKIALTNLDHLSPYPEEVAEWFYGEEEEENFNYLPPHPPQTHSLDGSPPIKRASCPSSPRQPYVRKTLERPVSSDDLSLKEGKSSIKTSISHSEKRGRFSRIPKAQVKKSSYSEYREKALPRIELSPLSESKKAETIDKQSIKALKKAWKMAHCRPPVSLEHLNEQIYSICKTTVWNHLKRNPATHDYLPLYSAVSYKVQALMTMVQKSGVVLENIIKRVEIFHSAISQLQKVHFKKERECIQIWLKTLAYIQDLNDFHEDHIPFKGSKDIATFLTLFKDFQIKKENQEACITVQKIFGDTFEKIYAVQDFLGLWGNPTSKTYALLDNHLRNACQECLLAKEIPFIEHSFPSPQNDIKKLKDLTVEQIMNSFRRDNQILFKNIQIGGKKFYSDLQEKKTCSSKEKSSSSKEKSSSSKGKSRKYSFWTALFKEIYKHLNPHLNPVNIKEQVALFKKSKNESIATLSSQIPCLPILGLMTVDWWAIGNGYFFNFFPSFREAPYGITPKKRVENCCTNDCAINFTEEGIVITQKKAYVLYPLVNPSSAASSFNEKRPIAEIPVLWTTVIQKNSDSLLNGEWQEKLAISNDGFKILSGAKEHEEWFVYKVLGNLTQIHMALLEAKYKLQS